MKLNAKKTKDEKLFFIGKKVVLLAAVLLLVLTLIIVSLSACRSNASSDLLPSSKPSETKAAYEPTANGDTTKSLMLNLDVNPSLQFSVSDGVVTDLIALNDDGKEILNGVDLSGMTVEKALPIVVKMLIQNGYLASEDQAPVMLLSTRGDQNAEELLLKAMTATTQALTENEIGSYVITQEIEDYEAVVALAEEHGVSVGKMQYALNVLREEKDLSVEDASNRTIVELFALDIESRLIESPYDVGDVDEYGETVLRVYEAETSVGYTPPEELTDDYLKGLAVLYHPRALEILLAPRVWSTMPNLIGLTEPEVLDLMCERNLSVRFAYFYDEALVNQGMEYGTCFYQAVEQGTRWNSDAGVQTCILWPYDFSPSYNFTDPPHKSQLKN